LRKTKTTLGMNHLRKRDR